MRTYHLTGAVFALFVVVGLAACGTSRASTTQTVTITLTDTGISATTSTFHTGMRYHFVITNNGTISHEFLNLPAGMAQTMNQMPMAQWHQQALHSSGMIGPGMMDTFDYAFANMPMLQQGQNAEFGCYADGFPLMHTPIAVQP